LKSPGTGLNFHYRACYDLLHTLAGNNREASALNYFLRNSFPRKTCPQERIAQRLGVTQRIVESHLHKSSEMKNGVNSQLERGFSVNTIAEKLDWSKRGHQIKPFPAAGA